MEARSSHIEVSVVIVNYNHKYFPRLALEALEKSKTHFNFEVIFVDNASNPTDESVDFLKQASKDGRIILIESDKNIGFGAGNNLGIKKARGKYVLLHNPDVTVKEDSIQKMYDYIQAHPDIGILGPKLIYSNGDIQPSCRRSMTFFDLVIKRSFLKRIPRFKKRYNQYIMNDFNHNKIQEVDLLAGAMMLSKKDFLWGELKGFDEMFFLFMEDFDLCMRAKKAGKKNIYYPEVEILHYHKRLSDGGFFSQFLKKTFWLHLASSIKYFWRWR